MVSVFLTVHGVIEHLNAPMDQMNVIARQVAKVISSCVMMVILASAEIKYVIEVLTVQMEVTRKIVQEYAVIQNSHAEMGSVFTEMVGAIRPQNVKIPVMKMAVMILNVSIMSSGATMVPVSLKIMSAMVFQTALMTVMRKTAKNVLVRVQTSYASVMVNA